MCTQYGLTLIELMTMVAIVLVVAAVSLPFVQMHMNQARLRKDFEREPAAGTKNS